MLWFSKKTDEQLIKGIQAKKESSFNALYERHQQALYHFLLAQTEQSLADDVFQICWQKVYHQAWQCQGGNIKAWIFTLARNSLIDELRKVKNLQNLEEWHEPSVEVNQDADIEQRWLNEQLSQLPFAQKEALCLQLEGFSLDDIATMTQSSIETIKSRLKLARGKLKEVANGN